MNCSNVTSNLDSSLSAYRLTTDVFLQSLFIIIGLAGNCLSIIVLRADPDKNATNWLLQTLAVSDTSFLLSCIPVSVLRGIQLYSNWWTEEQSVNFNYFLPYAWPLSSIAQTITVWLVILVTLDRYAAVCKPLSRSARSLERHKKFVGIIVIVALVYNLPRFFERRIKVSEDDCGNRTVKLIYPLEHNKAYYIIYKCIMYFLFRAVGPLILLVTLNTQLVNALRRVQKRRQDLSSRNANKENVTLLLIVVVTVFILLILPDTLLRAALVFQKFSARNSFFLKILRYVNGITNLLLTINSSCNFLIYCLIGRKFRRILRQLCRSGPPDQMIGYSETEPLTVRTRASNNVKQHQLNDHAL